MKKDVPELRQESTDREVLSMDEWLDELHRLEPVRTSMSAAEAVELSREDADLKVLHARSKRSLG